MEQTKILCLVELSEKIIKEKQGLSPYKIEELNQKLKYYVNEGKPKLNWTTIEEFNRISDLYVNFRYKGKFYAIVLRYDGENIFFEASFRTFNHKEYDSDDDEDSSRMTSYVFVPFKRLYSCKCSNGSNELTIDMYLKFVYDCLTMNTADIPSMR
jgi:hypothetical protein